jgi:hypothetical protein
MAWESFEALISGSASPFRDATKGPRAHSPLGSGKTRQALWWVVGHQHLTMEDICQGLSSGRWGGWVDGPQSCILSRAGLRGQ